MTLPPADSEYCTTMGPSPPAQLLSPMPKPHFLASLSTTMRGVELRYWRQLLTPSNHSHEGDENQERFSPIKTEFPSPNLATLNSFQSKSIHNF